MTSQFTKRHMARALIGTLTLLGALLGGAAPALADVALGVPATFPPTVTVGATNVPASFTIQNVSTAPENTVPVTLTDIQLVPACGTTFGAPPDNDCPPAFTDAGVFALSATGTGQVGTSCSGQTFNITQNSVTGQVTFSPVGPAVVLQIPNNTDDLDTCVIGFTFAVLKLPSQDASVASGLQTAHPTYAAGFAVVGGNTSTGSGTGSGFVTVRASASINTAATRAANGTLSDVATIASTPPGGVAPTGTVTFSVFGPGDTTCAGPVRFTSTNPVSTTNNVTTAASNAFLPNAASGGPGTYRFMAVYNGDAVYDSATSPCGAAGEQVDIPTPVINVVKEATPASRLEPGGSFTFSVVVSNPSTIDPITITALTDNIYGNLFGANPNISSNTCGTLQGVTLQPGASAPACSFVGSFTGSAGASQTDVVTVNGVDQNGFTATDTDDAIVRLTSLTPAIDIVKTASPLSLPAPGGTFTFSLVVTNTGPNSLTLTTLTDDVYGNIGTSTAAGNTCDDLIGRTLVPGEAASCSFEGNFAGTAGQSQTDVATVVGRDQNGNTATDNDNAVVTLTPASPPPPPPAAVSPAVSAPSGVARVSSPTGCVARPFNVQVTGRQIRQVVFYLDGKKVKTLNRPNAGTRFRLAMKPGTLRRGTHRVLAVTYFTKASGTKSRTLRVVFQRCSRQAVAPKFTG